MPDDNQGREIFAKPGVATYMLGIDKLLAPIALRFMSDGKICAVNPNIGIRIEGTNPQEGKLHVHFLNVLDQQQDQSDSPAQKSESEDADSDEKVMENPDRTTASKLFARGLLGSATKRTTSDVIIWEGKATGKDGSTFDFYIKRTKDSAEVPGPASQEYCGDGGCDALRFYVLVRRAAKDQFLRDAKKLPVSRIDGTDNCKWIGKPDRSSICYEGTAWPFEEGNVVGTLARRKYVIRARRGGGDAGMDTESLFLESDRLISKNLRLKLPVALPLFHQAICHDE